MGKKDIDPTAFPHQAVQRLSLLMYAQVPLVQALGECKHLPAVACEVMHAGPLGWVAVQQLQADILEQSKLPQNRRRPLLILPWQRCIPDNL